MNLDQKFDHALQKHTYWHTKLDTFGYVICNGYVVKKGCFKDTACFNDVSIVKFKDFRDLLECANSVPRVSTPIDECSDGHIIFSNCDEQITDQIHPSCKVVFRVNKRSLIA
jgi:hypothetical protein